MWAVVPVKSLQDAKGRLAAVLPQASRRELALAMLCDVLDTLAEVDSLEGTLVVTRDRCAAQAAAERDFETLMESESEPAPSSSSPAKESELSLNRAIESAAIELENRGVTAMLVIPGDVPLAAPEQIDSLCQRMAHTDPVPHVIVVPDRTGEGTNALACRPPCAVSFRYGPQSALLHGREAERLGIRYDTVHLESLALDVDTKNDLEELLRRPSNSRAQRLGRKILEARPLVSSESTGKSYAAGGASRPASRSAELIVECRAAPPAKELASELALITELAPLLETASELRDQAHRNVVTYSRKIFLPLTHLCRDICHYCIFAQPPKEGEAAFMSLDQLTAEADRGARAGCKEALFTLGDRPEARWQVARDELEKLGHESTLSYLREAAETVHRETGLLPHLNPGLMSARDLRALRPVSASMGIMLESASERLLEKGQAHYGCPDKEPAHRLETIRLAGEARVPFTSGILIGIGETRLERVEALFHLRALHRRYGHVQEIIVQNFRAKPETRMAESPEPDLDDLLWTIAIARLIFGPEMNIQAPPNLSPGALRQIITAGINDWGGVSPITPDFVNPEAPWPHLDELTKETEAAGKVLVERLTLYPKYALDPEEWLDPAMHTPVIRAIDGEGLAQQEDWTPGARIAPPERDLTLLAGPSPNSPSSSDLSPILELAQSGEALSEAQVTRLFRSRGSDFRAICEAADQLRFSVNGDEVTYVVNRNINYTNICYFKCQFCAFSKGKLSENLRGKPYDLDLEEIKRRTEEAWQRGATEVCMQGGIHPDYTGETYLEICRAVKETAPDIHVHAFSPLEVWQGAATLDLPLDEFLARLGGAGLGTLPGTAAEILDDEVREVLCADKIRTDQWLEVMETAHGLGFRTTATIMYGHLENYSNWARHLLRLRELQARTGGFTEFVPLPFVHMEAPVYLKGKARKGPTFREAVLMHAIARLVLHPHFTNIQASWVKMGPTGVKACLEAGVNDLGGTLMNESITRAAGAAWGQELPPAEMEDLIREAGRVPRQRTTPYGEPTLERRKASFAAAELAQIVNTPARGYERSQPLELVRPGLE